MGPKFRCGGQPPIILYSIMSTGLRPKFHRIDCFYYNFKCGHLIDYSYYLMSKQYLKELIQHGDDICLVYERDKETGPCPYCTKDEFNSLNPKEFDTAPGQWWRWIKIYVGQCL